MSVIFPATRLGNKSMIDETLWNRLVGRIVKDEGEDREIAERIMDQALAFLKLCSLDPQGHYSPSTIVDIGWHTFILYTKEYAAFCDKLAGHFIHHEPSDMPGVDYSTGGLARTFEALKRYEKSGELVVDEALWTNMANCRDCEHDCSTPRA